MYEVARRGVDSRSMAENVLGNLSIADKFIERAKREALDLRDRMQTEGHTREEVDLADRIAHVAWAGDTVLDETRDLLRTLNGELADCPGGDASSFVVVPKAGTVDAAFVDAAQGV